MKKTFFAYAVLAACLSLSSCANKTPHNEQKQIETVTKQKKASENSESMNTEKNISEKNINIENENSDTETTNDNVSDKKTTDSGSENKDVKLSQICSEIISSENISDAMLLEADAMSSLYGIDKAKIKQAAGFVTMSGTFPHEIIMIEAKSEQDAALIEEALNTKLSEVKNQAKSYDAENYELALQCKVYKNNNYVSLFLSPKQASMLKIYNDFIK